MLRGDGWSYLNKIEGFTQTLPTQPAVLIRAWISLQHHQKVFINSVLLSPLKKYENNNSSPSLNFQTFFFPKSNQSTSKRKTCAFQQPTELEQKKDMPTKMTIIQINLYISTPSGCGDGPSSKKMLVTSGTSDTPTAWSFESPNERDMFKPT